MDKDVRWVSNVSNARSVMRSGTLENINLNTGADSRCEDVFSAAALMFYLWKVYW